MQIEAREKSGIALSGGGFRASLYHIGVLASLSEKNLLKDIEVISCVSGGSITGAAYYLHLKKLLETKADNEIHQQDYINIVKQLEKDFLTQMEKNYSISALSNLSDNFKMFRKNYSISDKLSQLYYKGFYEKLKYDGFVTARKDGVICMSDLLIKPGGSDKLPGDIREFNKERINKIPILIINATTLNTGRNWQFTAMYMGEKTIPEFDDFDFESNVKLPTFTYKELPEGNKYKLFPLSVAVASSACVPGIFKPLPFTDLYENVLPQLVDGGVYDNQGLIPLLYEKCSGVIISDASKQINFILEPATDLLRVLLRTNSILMERVRYLGFELKCFLKKLNEVTNLNILHLRKDLGRIELKRGNEFKEPERNGNTRYGIRKNIQNFISGIRTNLDAFSEAESYAVMFSGYAMARNYIKNPGEENTGYGNWGFLKIEKYMNGSTDSKRLLKILRTGKSRFFKAFRLMPALIPAGLLITIIALAVLVIFFYAIIHYTGLWLVLIPLAFLIVVFILNYLTKYFTFENNIFYKISNTIITLGFSIFGFVYAQLYLRVINPFYVKYGKVEKMDA
jgi:predicted acylesterase/phospholipase RssA